MVLSYFTSYVYPSSSSSGSGNGQESSNRTVRRDWKSPLYGPPRPPNNIHPARSKGKGRAKDGDDDSSSPSASLIPRDPALAIIDYINNANSLYEVVGVDQKFTSNDELRRAYMSRCRVCHPE